MQFVWFQYAHLEKAYVTRVHQKQLKLLSRKEYDMFSLNTRASSDNTDPVIPPFAHHSRMCSALNAAGGISAPDPVIYYKRISEKDGNIARQTDYHLCWTRSAGCVKIAGTIHEDKWNLYTSDALLKPRNNP